tara:strand:+ start:271 stop:1275 length:1005 start_codon:yes stop_codon:yes gene_type:complete
MKVIKQSIGIDVSKDSLACCIGYFDQDRNEIFTKVQSFRNDLDGFKALLKWVKSHEPCNDIWYTMEATGVYYENLAYWLLENDLNVSVLLPSKVNHYSKTLEIKTKTDAVDARILAKMGLERKMKKWAIPSPLMREVRILTRELKETKAKLVVAKNQLHAKMHAYKTTKSTLRRVKKIIRLLESQIVEIEAELRVLVMEDSLLSDKIEKLESIPGISFLTIISLLGETNGFALFSSSKQLVSYAGLDIKHKQSGMRVGKSKISKQGNSFIRNALYMPALCSSRYNPDLKIFYNRINENKPCKKIGVTAVARKLLVLVYTLWKNDTEYIPNFKAA